MLAGADRLTRDEMLAALAWWREAGVDTLVEDAPRNWLGGTAIAEAAPNAPARVDAVPPAPVLPTTLPAFHAWLSAIESLPDGSRKGHRLLPQGDAASPLMVLIDMPEASETSLLAGDAGRLFDRMLAAIGRDRGSIYLASLCFDRPPGGRIDRARLDGVVDLARHHFALVRPQRLLIFGDEASRALLGAGATGEANGLRPVNYSGGTLAALASPSPRMLLRSPTLKARSWRDLRLWSGGIES